MLLESADALELCRAADGSSLGCAATEVSLDVLPALAGDHSCSPQQLGELVRQARAPGGAWIHGVLQVGDDARARLAELDARGGENVEQRAQIRRRLNVDLQLQDTEYLRRATLDWSHFQHAREAGPIDLEAYLAFALDTAWDANATAAYANYHVVALRLAARAQPLPAGPARKDLLTRAALAEASALHFLQDAFASGHFVGHWGGDATRLGTHDHYCAGIEALTWKASLPGQAPALPYAAHGDAFLSEPEQQQVGHAVAMSWLQVLDAASDPYAAAGVPALTHDAVGSETHDSCVDTRVAPGLLPLAKAGPIRDVLAEEPIPAPRAPALQRYRAEKGIFLGVAAGGDVGVPTVIAIDSGDRGVISRFRATARLGYGAQGLTDDPLNSLAFFDAGFTTTYVDATSRDGFAATGWTLRLRAPGNVTAVDGLICIALAEVTRWSGPITCAAHAARGGMGGLWRSRLVSGSTYAQLSLARDVTFNRYPPQGDPERKESRHELLAPLFTARSSIPLSGDRWAQSTDVFFDVGPTATWSTTHPSAVFGLFLSFSASTRGFP